MANGFGNLRNGLAVEDVDMHSYVDALLFVHAHIDTLASLMEETDATKLQQSSEKMMEYLQTAMTDLSEGSTMLTEAAE